MDVIFDMLKISFIYILIDFFSFDDILRGKISKFFFELIGSELNKLNVFYNLFVEMIFEKVCYEL